jgi:hypothetical protein
MTNDNNNHTYMRYYQFIENIYTTRYCKHWWHLVTGTSNTSCLQDAVWQPGPTLKKGEAAFKMVTHMKCYKHEPY